MPTITHKKISNTFNFTILSMQRFFIAISAFIISMIIASQSISYGGYDYIFLLPFSYGVLILLFPATWNYRKGHIGLTIYNVALLIRFAIIPLIRSFTDRYVFIRGFTPSPDSVQFGIYLMIFELIVSFVFIQLFAQKIYSNNTLQTIRIKTIKYKVILKFVLLLCMIIVALVPSILNSYHFFTNSTPSSGTTAVSGVLTSIVAWSTFIIPVLLVNFFKNKYDKTPSGIYVFLSLLSILPTMLFVSGSSRISVLVPTLAWMIILIKLYPKYKKRILISILTVITFVVLSVTLYKQFGYQSPTSSTDKFSIDFLAYSLDTYFSGPYNVGLAIDMNNYLSENIGAATLLNDIFYSVASISNLTDPTNTTLSYFNYTVYGRWDVQDQIVPMIGQGYTHFGFLFAPLFLCIFLYLMMLADNKTIKEDRFEFAFAYSFIAIFFAMSMMLNITIITPRITNYFIPILFIFMLNRKIRA